MYSNIYYSITFTYYVCYIKRFEISLINIIFRFSNNEEKRRYDNLSLTLKSHYLEIAK